MPLYMLIIFHKMVAPARCACRISPRNTALAEAFHNSFIHLVWAHFRNVHRAMQRAVGKATFPKSKQLNSNENRIALWNQIGKFQFDFGSTQSTTKMNSDRIQGGRKKTGNNFKIARRQQLSLEIILWQVIFISFI